MAINPNLITTIRVDQLPDEALSLTNLIPHSVGTDLKSATIQELVDLVATAIGVSGGVGYIAISVTDGQQLPDVPELPSFFLCGAGTYLNINGYPDIICTENLNAIMSLTDHWELAVEIPINPLSGTVQSVTGSAVDNTDPLNPVINEIIYGVQNIIAGTNITVDNTDPANPIVSATGGGGSQNLQQVTDEGNETTNPIKVIDTGQKSFTLQSNGILFEDLDESGNTLLRFEDTSVADQEVLIRGLGGTVALLSDITTPTLQEVTDEGNTTTNSIIIEDNESLVSFEIKGLELIGNDLSSNAPTFKLGYDGQMAAYDPARVQFIQSLVFDTTGDTLQNYEFPNKPTGTYTLATTDDIPSGGGGIPHATASGTDTYTATITGVSAYNDADAFLIRFTNGNTSSATLNINGLGAIPLYRNNDGVLIGGDIISGGEMLCIYNTSLNGFQVIGTAPNTLFSYVTNDDSVTLTKGMPVYAFGGTGDRMTVKRAYNTSDATSAQTVGLVLSTSIAAGQKGLIMMQGLLDGLSILPTSTFADGDAVYLGATAGTITNVKPYAPNHLVYLGVVTTASNGSAGRMYVRIQNGYELSEIHDIDLITNAPTNNQVLTYESSTDLWKNKSLGTILGYTPYKNIQTSQTVHTGTTAETVMFTATIPAGAFNSTDVIKVLFGANKTTALGTYVLRLRVNTTNTISGAPTIAYYSGSTTAQVNVLMRNFNLNGGNLYGFPFLTTSMSDIVAQGASLSSTTLNPANQFYIFATIVLNNSGDSIIGNMLSISN